MKNLEELFEHELKDLYNAEEQLLDALPKMKEKAVSNELKNAIDKHLIQTEEHKKRIAGVCGELGIEPGGKTCKAMEGIVRETKSFLEEDADEKVRDAGIIAEAQRV